MGNRFTIKPQRIRGIISELYEQSRMISRGAAELQEIRHVLRKMSGMSEVCNTLNNISEQMYGEARAVNEIGKAAGGITDVYSAEEERIRGKAKQNRNGNRRKYK